MRKTLISLLCAGAAASQAFAQSACEAPDGALIEVDNYAALTKKLSTIDQKAFKKDEWETQSEFAARVEPIVQKARSSLDLDRYYTLKSTEKVITTYDIERGILTIKFPSSYGNDVDDYDDDVELNISHARVKDRPWPYKSESISHQVVDVRPEKQKSVFFSANVLDVAAWEAWFRPRSRAEADKCGSKYPELVVESECRPAKEMELAIERERARKIKDKLQFAYVFKPRYPFYEKALDHFVYAEPPYPMNVETLEHNVYGAVYCAVLLDDQGRKMATLYTGYRPASEERQEAEAAARAEKERAEAALRAEKERAEAAARYKAAIASLQTALIDRGYEPGNADGEISEATVLALESFSSDSGYPLAGVDLSDAEFGMVNALTKAVRDTPIPAPKTGQVFKDCADCPSMVVVPAGSFKMGSPGTEEGRDKDEGPQRTVSIGSPLAVGRFEVTSAEWDACKADGACDMVRGDIDDFNKDSKAPIVNVSWDDAQAYVSWLSRKTGQQYRLLTEAEWEYAARAGTTTPFSFGATITPSQANYGGEHTYTSSTITYTGAVQVGSFSPNAWGLYDMHGNVSEWTQDCWNKNYRRAPTDGSAWPTGDCSKRVLRGGYWDGTSGSIRSASRNSWTDNGRYTSVGFRVARTLATK